MANRFYINSPLAAGPIELAGEEVHHLIVVSRLRPGDQVYLFNGDGKQYLARIIAATKRQARLEILSVEAPTRELPFRLQVAAPVPKGERAQFLIEKLTELGVDSFVPLRSERSVVQPGEGKLEKLRRYVIESSKQCGRNILLGVETSVDWPAYCRRTDLPATKLVAHPGGGNGFPCGFQDLALAVGPEGGFTQEEIDLAVKQGWSVLDLGPRVLRVETAAILLASWAIRNRAQ